MKKKLFRGISALLIAGLTYYFYCCTAIFHFGAKDAGSDAILLQTHWQQMGGFEKFTPQQNRIGCWGTALAQIFYYHQLQPKGTVAYTCSNGQQVQEDLSQRSFNFEHFVPVLDSTTLSYQQDEMAWYSYYTTLVVQKDFGTDQYLTKMEKGNFESQIENHFAVEVERYLSWNSFLPYTHGKQESIIVQEIQAQRPLYFYFTDMAGKGHATVIDGYRRQGGQFQVHLNQGQGGKGDQWYEFYAPILWDKDEKVRILFTIRPKENQAVATGISSAR